MPVHARNIDSTDFTVRVFDFLLNNRGFRDENLLIGQPADDHLSPTFTIIESKTGRLLGFIENFESIRSSETTDAAKAFLEYRHRTDLVLPVYAFEPKLANQDKFVVYRLTEQGEWIPLHKDRFPTLEQFIATEIPSFQKPPIISNAKGTNHALTVPEKVTVHWLWTNVPFVLWVKIAAVMLVIFLLGFGCAQTQTGRDIVTAIKSIYK